MQYGAYESERGQVECGVPQGSVLGPLFFLLYVNDMVRACGGLDLVLFADDTNIFAEGGDPAGLFGRVNRELGELSRVPTFRKNICVIRKQDKVQPPAGPHHVIDVDEEKQGAQDRALRDSTLNLPPA